MTASENVDAIFRRRITEILSRYPALRFEWSDDRTELSFPRADDDGFDVLVEIARDEVIVHAAGAHEHFLSTRDVSAHQAVEEALGFVRALLGPGVRIRELCAGGSAYRWYIEARDETGWRIESENGLLFFNYFGKRSERIYQNHHLAAPDSR